MSDILATIVECKQREIHALKRRYNETDLLELAQAQTAVRGFAAALAQKVESGGAAVIAEIKRASPSKGLIREDFEPRWLAQQYESGGAACLSVLTDQQFFQGNNDFLVQARAVCGLPVLRKDFMLDARQVLEARAIGADCILLIAAILSPLQMRELSQCAAESGLDVLVEVHDAAELRAVVGAGLAAGYLMGINNRNLRTFETRLETTLELLDELPDGCEVVTESGISSAEDIARMQGSGVRRFLIGEVLMRQREPGPVLRQWLEQSS